MLVSCCRSLSEILQRDFIDEVETIEECGKFLTSTQTDVARLDERLLWSIACLDF
jgi:hypothetical protein